VNEHVHGTDQLIYDQPTAFVEMFPGILDTTPGAWIQALQRQNDATELQDAFGSL
jgi:hypothetical protein